MLKILGQYYNVVVPKLCYTPAQCYALQRYGNKKIYNFDIKLSNLKLKK